MDPLDRLLRDDLNRLLDRIAASALDGPGIAAPPQDEGLRALMDRVESRLSEMRHRLLRDYGEWLRAMDECEDLWALSRLRGGEISPGDEPVAVGARRAA